MYKTKEGITLTPGKSFTTMEMVEQEYFGWKKDGDKRVRVSLGTEVVEQEIRHTKNWHRLPEEWKQTVGLVKIVKGPSPEGYDPLLHTLADGDTVDGIIEQVIVPRDLDDAKTQLSQALIEKAEFYRYRAEIELPGGIVLPVGEKTLGMLTLGRGRGIQDKIKLPIGGRRYQVNQQEIEAIDAALFAYHQAVHDRQYDLGEAIDAASTAEDLNAIDIDAGWPPVYNQSPLP